MARQIAVFILFTLVIAMDGCGSGNPLGSKDHVSGPSAKIQPPSGGDLPGPAALLKASSGAGDAMVNGGDFNPAWPHQNVTVDGAAAVFAPATGNPPVLADMAYAIYRFDLSAIEPQFKLLLDWLTAPEAEDLWVALSDWEHDRWVWYGTSNAGQVAPPSFSGCINGNGILLVALAVAGNSSATLNGLTIPVLPDSWRCLGHDRRHTGSSPYLGPPVDYLKWTYTIGNDHGYLSSPVIWTDGTIYVGAHSDLGNGLYAFNPDGTVKWVCNTASVLYDTGGANSAPAIGADGTVYACGEVPDVFYAIGPDGSIKWTHEITRWSRVLVAKDGTIYVTTHYPIEIYAFLPDGTLKWKTETEMYYAEAPALDDAGNIYILEGGLFAYNSEGIEKWSIELDGNFEGPTIGADGTIYFVYEPFSASTEDTLYAVNPDGTIKFTHAWPWGISQCPVIGADGTLYMSSDIYLYALNADGTEKWKCRINDNIYSFMALDAAGTVYVSGCKNYFGAVSATGEIIWERWLSDASAMNGSPAIGADGCVYVTCDNNLMAFGPTSGSHSVSGRVIDQAGNGIAGVKFTFDCSIAPVTTDADGYWAAQGVGDGDYRITPGLAGDTFTPPFMDITVSGTDTAVADFTGEAASQGDWWCFGRDRRHTRRSPYIGAQTANVKWTYETGSWIESSPAVGSDGTIYVGSYDHKLYAICPDGEKKWSYTFGLFYGKIDATPAIAVDGTIYIAYDDEPGKLYAINSDGTVKWYSQFGTYGVNSSSAIGQDGTVYTVTGVNYLKALNPSGEVNWSFHYTSLCSSPAVDSNGLIYVGGTHDMYALNPDGSEHWRYVGAGNLYVESPAIGADGTVYFGTDLDSLYALNSDGSLQWVFPTGDAILSSPALGADGTIYIGCTDKKMYAVNPDGSLQWSYTTGDQVLSSPAVGADGVIYFGSDDHKVYAVKPDGSPLWSYTTGGPVESSPAIAADGTVYIGSKDYKLYAFQDE